MGLFKSMKDMKAVVAEAPGMIAEGQALAANAQVLAAQQQAAYGQQAAAPAPSATGDDFEPINGVSIELYAEICRELAAVGNDQAKGRALAAAKGVAEADWDAAVAGWMARMQGNLAVGSRFNALYMGR